MTRTWITDYRGAQWLAEPTTATGDRAVWCQWHGGKSVMPHIVGFYAPSVESARVDLQQSPHVIDGYNVEFLGAKPARMGEDY
jgi:hypothetical protein